MEPPIKSYRELIVWKKSVELTVAMYRLTAHFPESELYGLTAQVRRASISIPSNIAEGRRRSSRKDFRYFLLHAFGSGAELETQLEIAKQLSYGRKEDYEVVDRLLNEVMRMLNTITKKLQATS